MPLSPLTTPPSRALSQDVKDLKKVFDEYDKDGSGNISLSEFTQSLKEKKAKSQPSAGVKSTLAQRKAAEGISIFDLSEGVFHEMDEDGSGDVTFRELLKLMFKYARPDEIDTMMTWVRPPRAALQCAPLAAPLPQRMRTPRGHVHACGRDAHMRTF